MKKNNLLLFIVNDPVFFLSHRLPIARAAKQRGLRVCVASPEEDCVNQIRREGFIFYPLTLSKHGTSLVREIQTFWGIYRLFRRVKPDLIHLLTIKPVIYGGIAARLAKVPAVVSAVTGMGTLFLSSNVQKRLLRFFAKQAYRTAFGCKNQTIVFQNSDDMEFCIKSGLAPEGKAILIKGSGVDMQQFSPRPSSNGTPVVLLAGRMLWEKGVAEFVDAARLIRGRSISAQFVLVGDSVSWNASSVSDEQLKRWCDEGIIEWWGRREDMLEVFSQTEIACLPSYGEGVPKFLIEAAACGKAIVTTDSPGCREIVHHEKNGLLVPVGNALALADALERLLRDEPLRLKMGGVGRLHAVQGFSQELVVRQTLDTYSHLLRRL